LVVVPEQVTVVPDGGAPGPAAGAHAATPADDDINQIKGTTRPATAARDGARRFSAPMTIATHFLVTLPPDPFRRQRALHHKHIFVNVE
jgi:hypothetical protein